LALGLESPLIVMSPLGNTSCGMVIHVTGAQDDIFGDHICLSWNPLISSRMGVEQ
jgi:hypothetical protein